MTFHLYIAYANCPGKFHRKVPYRTVKNLLNPCLHKLFVCIARTARFTTVTILDKITINTLPSGRISQSIIQPVARTPEYLNFKPSTSMNNKAHLAMNNKNILLPICIDPDIRLFTHCTQSFQWRRQTRRPTEIHNLNSNKILFLPLPFYIRVERQTLLKRKDIDCGESYISIQTYQISSWLRNVHDQIMVLVIGLQL